ncbi:hypothetical protein GALL_541880 [mine drainage metagenome]|uniref:Uncharacterized protein n=1 Tax=mine drainage metagenome TaxID=410659 RepID=A0A1J5PL51_9ZZZZ
MDLAEAADIAHVLDHDAIEVEVVHGEIPCGLRQIAQVARAKFLLARQALGASHQGHAASGLHVFGTGMHDQAHPRIGVDVLGVLGNGGDQDHRVAVVVEHEGRDRGERMSVEPLGQGAEHPVLMGADKAPGFGGKFESEVVGGHGGSFKESWYGVLESAKDEGFTRAAPPAPRVR